MNKASSALLATAGVTVGLLGFALPAGAATTSAGGYTPPSGQCSYSPPLQHPATQTGLARRAQTDTPKGPSSGDPKGPSSGDPKGPSSGDPKGPSSGDPKGHKPDPCPTNTKKKPEPCQWVEAKPGKTYDKRGHGDVKAFTTAKRAYVCHPKPCPTKAKPCPPKCKKTGKHKHSTHPNIKG
ncbi:MAG TPA: hypothetical protein VH089_20100 [Streptosporangiaceae bacterium]|nr:hypothetical protein [Streptosporangiaceae bacterium]